MGAAWCGANTAPSCGGNAGGVATQQDVPSWCEALVSSSFEVMPAVVRSVSSEMPPRGESRATGRPSWNQKGVRGVSAAAAAAAELPRSEHVRLIVLPVRTYNSDAPPIDATAAAKERKVIFIGSDARALHRCGSIPFFVFVFCFFFHG